MNLICELSVPCGVVVILLIVWVYPERPGGQTYYKRALTRVDWPGLVFSLIGTILLVFGLQEGGVRYAWKSATIITTLVVSGVCWFAFCAWEVWLSSGSSPFPVVPLFPLTLMKNRVVAAALG